MEVTAKSNTWKSHGYFMGCDWATRHHDVVVLDREGRIVLDLQISHTAEGWRHLRDQLVHLAGPDLRVVAVTIETTCGPAVEQLLALGCSVYPLNSKAGERYRDRKAPSGVKTDHLDALSFADALRTDGHAWRPLNREDPRCRSCGFCAEMRSSSSSSGPPWSTSCARHWRNTTQRFSKRLMIGSCRLPGTLWNGFPTPQELKKAGKRQWEKFLHTHRLYRSSTYAKRLEIFGRATEFCGSQAVTNAKSILAVAVAKQLRVLEQQLRVYRDQITLLFREHPDHDLFGSLPGVGEKLGPRLLSECGDDRGRFEGHEALQSYAGTAPISFQSGQVHRVLFRRACNKHLRAAVHLWADLSRAQCTWAQVYYEQKRREGKSHACALRCLGQRWLKILWKMWQTKQPYDEQLHTRNQVKHGSWVLALTPSK
jgi:hypothetical protein